ncbi:antigenic heat-stable protein [Rhynchospora pubera]|uniref:Antigenic heat-stable protein n=1 Tax=Rhynchospora pubera TaxID=906938 RepID=A0AAV8FB34_9POAL|nr:antigenic heat-stable protein [Rhynchospora pubera]
MKSLIISLADSEEPSLLFSIAATIDIDIDIDINLKADLSTPIRTESASVSLRSASFSLALAQRGALLPFIFLSYQFPVPSSLSRRLRRPTSPTDLMAEHVVAPEDVLESLMNDGTVDAIRMKVISQLKANEDMKRDTMVMVEQSKTLNTPGAEKQSKRDLFDALRRELETPVLEKASKAVWEIISGTDGLGKEITDTVEKVFLRLSGHAERPAAPVSTLNNPLQEENGDLGEPSTSSHRKRSFGDAEIHEGGDADALANGPGKRSAIESSESSGV